MRWRAWSSILQNAFEILVALIRRADGSDVLVVLHLAALTCLELTFKSTEPALQKFLLK